jgi:hypothetical protein
MLKQMVFFTTVASFAAAGAAPAKARTGWP